MGNKHSSPPYEPVKTSDMLLHKALIRAIKSKYPENVKLLLSNAALDPAIKDNLALRTAIKYDESLAIAALLIQDKRVDVSTDSDLLLRVACLRGNTELVKELVIKHNVDPSVMDQNAIMNACMKGHTKTVEFLLTDSRVDPTVRCDRAVRLAVFGEYYEISDLLLTRYYQPRNLVIVKT
ncbi:Hypothetical protein POVR2_LOCUS198 [uncultured virus]|nr:Hypothetical protein POVR2_LOCUS198 [uncultured virus]